MELIDEIHAFAREYVNNKNARTRTRNAKIREAYEIRTGKKIRISCSTCYIEALYELINNTKMATRNYELKRGYLAQFTDGAYEGIKAFTNDTMTDKLAEEYLRRYPSRAIYFARLPVVVPINAPSVRVIPPAPKTAEVDEIIEGLLNKVPTKKSTKTKK